MPKSYPKGRDLGKGGRRKAACSKSQEWQRSKWLYKLLVFEFGKIYQSVKFKPSNVYLRK
jgi:hypothetical protein